MSDVIHTMTVALFLPRKPDWAACSDPAASDGSYTLGCDKQTGAIVDNTEPAIS